MKKTLYAALFLSVAAITSVKADTIPAPVIGVVEQALLEKTAATASIKDQIEKKRNEFQKEMTSYENSLKAEEKKLAEEQKKLSEKEFNDKRQAFEKKIRDAQERLQVRTAQMEIAVEDARKVVYDAFLKAADEVKKETGANMIIYKETVVTADNSFDLTSKVLEKLNKALPTVKVTFKPEAEVKKLLQQQQ